MLSSEKAKERELSRTQLLSDDSAVPFFLFFRLGLARRGVDLAPGFEGGAGELLRGSGSFVKLQKVLSMAALRLRMLFTADQWSMTTSHARVIQDPRRPVSLHEREVGVCRGVSIAKLHVESWECRRTTATCEPV